MNEFVAEAHLNGAESDVAKGESINSFTSEASDGIREPVVACHRNSSSSSILRVFALLPLFSIPSNLANVATSATHAEKPRRDTFRV